MKYLKIGIVSLLAIAMVVGIVGVTSNMTKEKEHYEYDILYLNVVNVSNRGDIEYNPIYFFDDLYDILEQHINKTVVYTLSINSNIDTINIEKIEGEGIIITFSDLTQLLYTNDGNFSDEDANILKVGTYTLEAKILFLSPAKVSGTGAILLQLAPLIFIASVLGYIMFTTSKEGNE